MTPHDHNRTLSLLHGLIGVLALTGLAVAAAFEARRRPSDAFERLGWLLYLLPLPLLQLLTAYGLLSARKWGRVLALILCVLYVWVFPLGTLLAAYTWWFMHSAGARQLYGLASAPGADGR
jgi:hypothetical protein